MNNLPITKVVLYKHGVGYFERVGEVEGDASVDLQFKAAEMNDVLKSLTTLDLDSGRVVSMSYESTLPLEKQLENLSINLEGDGSLTSLLGQVKGARVKVEEGTRTVEGSVAGVQTIARRHDGVTTKTPYLVLLLEGGALQTFDLTEAKQVTFLDPTLRKDLQHLLDVLIGSKKKDLKKLTIFARGEGKRKILAGYIVETPVWKTSYRVLLDEGEPALLQGWALVDNTQDDDWEDVTMSLVAGLPISFVHDLYSPRYKKRPVVEVQEEEAYAPPMLGAAMEADYGSAPMMPSEAEGAAPGGGMRYLAMAPPPPAAAPKMSAAAAARSVEVQTRTVEVSDLFQYDITHPVTVRRGESALVPILQGPFEGRRIAIYNAEVRDKNPMSAIFFKNTTGLTLEGGPLTVFENGTYVGESMIEPMHADEERIVPFSVELGCLVNVDSESRSQNVSRVVIVSGRMAMERVRVQVTTYQVRSKLAKPLDLYIEHPFIPGGTLVDTPKPAESTANTHRFRVAVAARETLKFVVTEHRTDEESLWLSSARPEQIEAWIQARWLDAKTIGVLREVVDEQRELIRLQVRINEREREIREVFDDQERLRKNLQSLGNTSDEKSLRERYVREMTAAEDRLAQFRGEVKEWKASQTARREQLDARLYALQFEGDVKA